MSTIVGSIPWGLDFETGVLRHVLLGKPDYFEWRPVSAVARQTLSLGLHFDAQVAMSQHREMVDVYERAGVACHWLDARPELKYGVFARDSSVMTPFGPVITMPQTRFRRGDYALTIKFYQDAGIPIWNMITAGHFEGGDFMVVEPGFVLCGYGGERSEKEGAEQMCDWFRAEDWEAYPVPFPPHFVHLDVSVGFINEKLVAVAQDAHQPWFLDLLKSKGYEILPISYYELDAAWSEYRQSRRRSGALNSGEQRSQCAHARARHRSLRSGSVDVHAGRRRPSLPLPGS